jgi:hypothetical protein
MPEFCTCGAQLPPDALFCHKCGKPQRELQPPESDIHQAAEPVALRPIEARGSEPPLNFRNRVAVRIAFMVSAVTTLLSWLPFVNVILWTAAGFFAVFFYRRRTGYLLSIKAGVRMGWITGVITSLIITATFVIPMAVSGNMVSLFESQLKNLPANDPNVQQAMQLLQTGPGVALLLFVVLGMLFVFITCLSMAGGALGAKIAGGNE